ncbi:hypothetical protein FOZ62_009425, partial [Perkinsus olseni]
IRTPAALGQHLDGTTGGQFASSTDSDSAGINLGYSRYLSEGRFWYCAAEVFGRCLSQGAGGGLGAASNGHKLSWEEGVKLDVPFDLKLSISEDDNLLKTIDITGVEGVQQNERKEIVDGALAAEPNLGPPFLTDLPTVELKFKFASSGILRLVKA